MDADADHFWTMLTGYCISVQINNVHVGYLQGIPYSNSCSAVLWYCKPTLSGTTLPCVNHTNYSTTVANSPFGLYNQQYDYKDCQILYFHCSKATGAKPYSCPGTSKATGAIIPSPLWSRRLCP